MNTVKLYLHSMKMLLKCQLEYPLSFLLNTMSQLIMTGGELMAVILLIDRFTSIGQWTGSHILFFFGLMTLTHYLVELFARGISGFSPIVRSGALDTMLLRPRGILTQVNCHAIDPRRIGCLAVGLAAMIMGSRQSGVIWTIPKVLVMIESVAGGYLLITGLFLIEAVFCMHSVKSVEMVNVLTYGGRSTCQYPIDIYPGPLRLLFTVVAPFALTTHLPAAYVLDMPMLGIPSWLAFLSPLAGGVTFIILYLAFQRALKYYRSTGS